VNHLSRAVTFLQAAHVEQAVCVICHRL